MWLVLWTLNPHWCYDQMEVLYHFFHRNLEELLKCIFRSLLVMFWCFEMTRFEILMPVCFSSFAISVEGLSKIIINTGQDIFIEGCDEDNPYVAKVTRLYGDGESYSHKLGFGSANQGPDM